MSRSSARSGTRREPHASPGRPAAHRAWRGGKLAGLSTIAAAVTLLFVLDDARALPKGGAVVNGRVTIETAQGNEQTVNQRSPKGIIEWQSFSINPGETLTVRQPDASAVLLNRVLGSQQSTISGAISANGKVFLVNPNGVVFTPGVTGQSISVGSIVASTLDIANADFLAGRYRFSGTAGLVANRGADIKVAPGGSAILLGGHVTNEGHISATLGTVGMAAGSDISVDFAGDGLTTLHINKAAARALVENRKLLEADGGKVLMSAQTAEALTEAVVNQQGIVRAQTLTQRAGHIVLDGGSSGVTQVSGTLDASGDAMRAGGRIDVSGNRVKLIGRATLDASGGTGGGAVRIVGGAGGLDPRVENPQTLSSDAATSVQADASVNGDGGHIALDGGRDGVTQLSGTLSARGDASHAGGHIDVTGHQVALVGRARIDASGGAGGGTVRLGGGARGRDPGIANAQALWLGADTSVKADASANGKGGQIVAYSVDATRIYGTLSVLGGPNGGSGGLVETSGGRLDVDSATVRASAADRVGGTRGTGGTWLLDPHDITITAATDNNTQSSSAQNTVTFEGGTAGTASQVSAASIETQLNQGVSVTVSTDGGGTDLGDITVQAPIAKSAGATATLTLDAADSIIMRPFTPRAADGAISSTIYPSITSTSPDGHLNVVLNANKDNGHPGASGVLVAGDDNGVTRIGTGGGDLGIGTTKPGGDFDGGAVNLSHASVDTLATDGGASGSVTIRGMSQGLFNGVTLTGTQIRTDGGDIDIRGLLDAPSLSSSSSSSSSSSPSRSTGQVLDSLPRVALILPAQAALLAPTPVLSGVYIGPYQFSAVEGPTPTPAASTLQTGAGSISVFGYAQNANDSGTRYVIHGVTLTGLLPDGSSGAATAFNTQTGGIDVRGVANYTNAATASAPQFGTDIEATTFASSGAHANPLMFSGATNTADAGLNLNGVNLNAVDANVVLRPLNDGASPSLAVANSSFRSGGVLDFTPGGIDASFSPTTQFTLTRADQVPIDIFTGASSGLSITSAMLAQFAGFRSWVFGSDTHTGRITVAQNGCTSTQTPSVCNAAFATSVTLANSGAGSGGITALYGLTLTGQTLVLSSAGPVSIGGPIVANALLLAGPSSFTLRNAGNSVDVLAAFGAGNVDYVNAGSFVIGSMSSPTYQTRTNTIAQIDASNSTALHDFTAQALSGGIGLGGGAAQASGPTGHATVDLHAGDNLDLVMENGVFSNAGSGTLGTGDAWHVWALTWEGETRGGIEPGNALPNFYGCSFGAGCTWGGVVPLATNHFVYVKQPSVTVTATDESRPFGAPNPPFRYTTSPLVNGDPSGSVSGSFSSAADANSAPGDYPITGSFTSPVGYRVDVVPALLTVEPLQRAVIAEPEPPPPPTPGGLFPVSGLQTFFSDRERSFVYENNMGGLNVCVGSNQPIASLLHGDDTADRLAIEWKRVRTQPNLNNCIVINSQHGCGDF